MTTVKEKFHTLSTLQVKFWLTGNDSEKHDYGQLQDFHVEHPSFKGKRLWRRIFQDGTLLLAYREGSPPFVAGVDWGRDFKADGGKANIRADEPALMFTGHTYVTFMKLEFVGWYLLIGDVGELFEEVP